MSHIVPLGNSKYVKLLKEVDIWNKASLIQALDTNTPPPPPPHIMGAHPVSPPLVQPPDAPIMAKGLHFQTYLASSDGAYAHIGLMSMIVPTKDWTWGAFGLSPWALPCPPEQMGCFASYALPGEDLYPPALKSLIEYGTHMCWHTDKWNIMAVTSVYDSKGVSAFTEAGFEVTQTTTQGLSGPSLILQKGPGQSHKPAHETPLYVDPVTSFDELTALLAVGFKGKGIKNNPGGKGYQLALFEPS